MKTKWGNAYIQHGYYVIYGNNNVGKVLHRFIFEDFYGPIPSKCVIHHKDGNSLNNCIMNLQCLPRDEHTKIHMGGKYGKHSNAYGHKLGKYRGTSYSYRTGNPWTKVWKTKIAYNGYETTLGTFIEPISGEIVYNLVKEELL